jgi:hypothetical protein
MKKHLFNEHEIKDYFCDELANNWEKINKSIIEDKYIFNSALNFHRKLIKKGISSKSKKYWDLVDRYIYKNHKKKLNQYFSMNN